MHKKNEISSVGGVAGYNGGGNNPTINKSNVIVKTLNNKKIESVMNAKKLEKQIIESIVRKEIINTIVEQKDSENIIDLYDNISKLISLSIQYSRMFLYDGIKLLDPKATQFSVKRAKAEIGRVKKLVMDLDQIMTKICDQTQNQATNHDENQ